MSTGNSRQFSRDLASVNQKISGISRVIILPLEYQRLEDNIMTADLMPVLQTMSGMKYSVFSENWLFIDDSVSNANKYAESLTDLSYLGLEKSKKLQRGYLKVGLSVYCLFDSLDMYLCGGT